MSAPSFLALGTAYTGEQKGLNFASKLDTELLSQTLQKRSIKNESVCVSIIWDYLLDWNINRPLV